MPELPEVETTKRGIEPHITGAIVKAVTVRQRNLRWPIPQTIDRELPGQTIQSVERRGKYLLLKTATGTVLIHLGMSGNLRIVKEEEQVQKHDHVDLVFDNGNILRFRDPRKFGCFLWLKDDPLDHPLLSHLGPEPLSHEFNAQYLYNKSRKRKAPIKSFIMDSHIVVGVGNIYASEALFSAGIHPLRKAGRISCARYDLLTNAISSVLESAIEQGGTTLRDFLGGDGRPGYFKQSLNVYGRGRMPCVKCEAPLKEIRLGQRSTVYCPQCQH